MLSNKAREKSTNIPITDKNDDVFLPDSSRFNKSLRTNNPDGKPIFRITTDDEESQAEFVANEIKKIISGSKGLINYKDIAVLMRMNFISRQFEGAFKCHKIPFTIVSSIGCYINKHFS